MNVKLLKYIFNYYIFYFLFILLLLFNISLIGQDIVIAQSTNQQQSANAAEHFSLVLPLDPEGEATVNDSFQQNNLFAFVYGKSNLKVLDLETENIIYEVSYPESSIYLPFLMDEYLIYLITPGNNGLNYETIRVDLSTEGKESISFPGSSNQITDDGYLITHHRNLCQLIDLDVGQVIFEPDVSKGGRGKILCVDDVIVFPIVDNHSNPAGYKAMSTNEEVKFFLEEIFNEVRIFLPDYRSEISTFPIPILICNHYNDPNEKQWLLKFVNKEGQTIASYSPADLDIEYAYECITPTPLRVLDENQNNILLQIRCSTQGEPQRYYYILTDLSGNILKIFNENVFDATNYSAFDHQGNILLFQNRDGPLRDILNYYQQDGTSVFSKQVPVLVPSGWPREFKFLGMDAILGYEYNQFEKYSLTDGELTGIYPISTDYQIYTPNTVVFGDQVYFFAKHRGGCEPKILGSNYFSFSTSDSGWLDIELVSIRPNAGTTYEVWDNTEVKVKFRTEYGGNFGENLSVNFEKGEVLTANSNNLEYTWHTPTIVSGNQDTAKITVSYGPVSQEFIITIKDHLPTASFAFNPISPQTGQNVHFDGSLSADLDGEISIYHWDFGDGTVEQEQEQDYIDHEFSTTGEYPVTLTVTDNNEQTAQISQTVRVTAAPVANFKLLDPSPQWDTKVRFDASLSSDPDGSIVSYQWDFGDGTTGEGINVSHEFKYESRNFDVTLTVTDNQNLSSSKTIKVSYGWILSYENKGDIGIPAALIGDNNLVNYLVTVITGDCNDAGTNSQVFIALYGPEKEHGRYGSKEIQLWSFEDYLGDFEKGNKDTFSVKGYNLDEIEFITLRHKNDQSNPGWYVKAVKVKNQNNQKEWLFVPDQWLGTNKPPDYQAWGKFYPVQPHSILFKWKDRSLGMIEASDQIFILPKNAESFYFQVLNRGFNLEVFQQEFSSNGTVNNTFVGNQSFTENHQGLSYSKSNITKPTRFLVKIKEGSSVKEELYIWVFPGNWKDHKNEARKITLLYPLKGSTGIFLQGEALKNYLTNLKVDIMNASMPILKYGADSLKLFGSVPDEELLFYIRNPTQQYVKNKIGKILTAVVGTASATIIGEIVGLYDSLSKAAEWASRLDEVIEISTGEIYKIDLLKDIGNNDGNFLQSLELLEKLKVKIDSLIVEVENNDLLSCIHYLEAIKTLTVGNNPASENKNDHIIDYSVYGVPSFLETSAQSCHSSYSQVEDYPLSIILADELYNIKSWRDYHHGYLDAYFAGGMSQQEINAALAEIGASPLLDIDTLQSDVGLSDESKKEATNDVMDVYEPIIKKLLNISRILINVSLLTDQAFN